MEIQRYRLAEAMRNESSPNGLMAARKGNMVLYADHEKALATLRSENDKLKVALRGLLDRHNDNTEEEYWAEWDTAIDALQHIADDGMDARQCMLTARAALEGLKATPLENVQVFREVLDRICIEMEHIHEAALTINEPDVRCLIRTSEGEGAIAQARALLTQATQKG